MGLSLSCIKTVDDYVKHLDCNRVLPSKTLGKLKINKNIINAETQHTINDIKQNYPLFKNAITPQQQLSFILSKTN